MSLNYFLTALPVLPAKLTTIQLANYHEQIVATSLYTPGAYFNTCGCSKDGAEIFCGNYSQQQLYAYWQDNKR